MKNRVEIKSEAKDLIRTARVSPLAVTAIVLAIEFILDRVVNLVETGRPFFQSDYLSAYLQAVATGDPDAMLALMDSAFPYVSPYATFFSILTGLFMTVLLAGYYVYCMGIRQRIQMPYSSLLDGLSVAGRVIWCQILIGIKIFLWSMLFFFPGVVAIYRYRFAIYNILTDDTLSASGAIRLSCKQTRGMKANLFVLDLSFVGWSLLSSLTMGLLGIWLTPYMTLCDLAYFEEGQRRLGRPPYGGSSQPDAPDQGNPSNWQL